jgi:hypothetical protein
MLADVINAIHNRCLVWICLKWIPYLQMLINDAYLYCIIWYICIAYLPIFINFACLIFKGICVDMNVVCVSYAEVSCLYCMLAVCLSCVIIFFTIILVDVVDVLFFFFFFFFFAIIHACWCWLRMSLFFQSCGCGLFFTSVGGTLALTQMRIYTHVHTLPPLIDLYAHAWTLKTRHSSQNLYSKKQSVTNPYAKTEARMPPKTCNA